MIVEGIFDLFFTFVKFLIGLFPSNVENVNGSLQGFIDLIGYGIYVVGPVTFVSVVASFTAWTVVNMAWAVIEWIYKKLPGIN